jgi:hypothetical protein
MNADCIEKEHFHKSNGSLTALAALYVVIALCVTLFSLYLTFLLKWQGPFRDLWEFVDNIEKQFHGIWSWTYLLDAYGGAHRIFFPKLLFFADYYWLNGRNDLTVAVALTCQAGYWLIILHALRTCLSWSIAERIIISAMFVLALFSTTQVSNFLYAMDVQWYMSNLFGLLSLYALAFCEKKSYYWLIVIGTGTIAALCNFTGLMSLLVAAIVIICQRRYSIKNLSVFFVIIGIMYIYIHNNKNSTHVVINALQHSNDIRVSITIILNTLRDMVIYIPRYLASPLSREWPVIGNILASVGIATTLLYWLKLVRNKSNMCAWQKLCLYIATYITLSAIFTAFGRLIYPNSAIAERYQTLVLPWLPSVLGLLWWDLRNIPQRMIFFIGSSLVFTFFLLPAQLTSAKNMVTLSTRVNLAHTAARAGVLDFPYIQATLSYPLIKNKINSAKDNDTFLRDYKLGYFQHLKKFSLHNHVSKTNKLPACQGHTTLKYDETTQSWLIDGQLFISTDKPASDIALVQQDNVIGLGTLIGADNSFLPPSWQTPSQSHFRAFINAHNLTPQNPIELLGISEGNAQCKYTLQLDSIQSSH